MRACPFFVSPASGPGCYPYARQGTPEPCSQENNGMPAIRHPKDFVAGLIFLAFGIAAIVLSSAYPLGTAARMGPGYFPRILGILLIVLGLALALRALRLQGGPLPHWPWRPTVVVITSVVLLGVVVIGLKLQLPIWPWTSGILPWSS